MAVSRKCILGAPRKSEESAGRQERKKIGRVGKDSEEKGLSMKKA